MDERLQPIENSPDMSSIERPYRVLLVVSHPTQWAGPRFRFIAEHAKDYLDFTVTYCSLQGAEPGVDPEFAIEIEWDIPLLDGFRWLHVPNESPRPGLGHFLGLINPGLWKLISTGDFDAVVVYGYAYFSFWLAIFAARRAGVPVIMATDAVRLHSGVRGGWWWKRWVKGPLVRSIYRLANVVLVPSTATREFILSIGIPEERLALAHYVVDNDYFGQRAALADRSEVRRAWGIPENAYVVLFCAKLTSWKRPQDVLRAFASIRNPHSTIHNSTYLVFAGEGPLREALEQEARALGIAEQVRFLGFINQSRLPEVYAASDLLVLPSEYEAWGLVVNEAMVCGLPVVVSDRVGARLDLIREGETGFVYPVGDVDRLAAILRRVLSDAERLKRMGKACRQRMETWSYREHREGFIQAVEGAILQRRKS